MSQSVYCWADPLSDSPIWNVIYHTAICVEFQNGIKYEFSYNDRGLNTTPAGDRRPRESHYLGRTNKTLAETIQHAYQMQSTTYRTYDPLTTNCCHFSNDLALWLCNEPIPAYYVLQSAMVPRNPVVSGLVRSSGGFSSSSS